VINSYLNFAGWDFGETVNKNILIAKASQIPGVKYVSSLSLDIVGSTTYAELEVVSTVPTGNVKILRAGVVPVGASEVTVI
jgi:hypothetical protein